MFGYLRPDKNNLLVKDYARYKSIYCGLCKSIKKDYGNIARLSLTYDLTFFAVMAMSFSEETKDVCYQRCFLNPFVKKSVASVNKHTELAASIGILLVNAKINDDINDTRNIIMKKINCIKSFLFSGKYKKAKKHLEDYDRIITEHSLKIAENEKKHAGEKPVFIENSDLFGKMTEGIYKKTYSEIFENEREKNKLVHAAGLFGYYIGKWIYLIDGIDDYEQDIKSKEFNPFLPMTREEAKEEAEKILLDCELKADRIAALLPYKKDGRILGNIVQKGLPFVRESVFSGEKIVRV